MSGVGKRLLEERKRLNLSAERFAALGGLKGNAQYKYESDERSPDAAYLAALYRAGVDVMYVLTGRRDPYVNEAEHQQLVAAYDAAPPTVRAAALGALIAGLGPAATVHTTPCKAPTPRRRLNCRRVRFRSTTPARKRNSGHRPRTGVLQT
ncbi:hypothetical protein GCM10007860_06290 [Chitiniphilus shinanonensis]|uniref:Uncharacterized protein n=1 Tax=Chitiniphilus shinanonensis TaxID=553088 RepID=A0ABQ6BQL8_9NEIS|nr:hypothetical protein GCM10007860_06290 [Chitiniphilus shinanonensis]